VGIAEALAADGDFEVVGEAGDGSQVLPLVRRTRADAVLLDLRMPAMDGFGCLERLRDRHPGVKVVMLASESDPALIAAAFKRGACGYVVKTVEPRDLGPAIREALDGTAYHAAGLPGINDEAVAHAAGLSRREFEIVRAVARGLSNRAIAHELWISEQTVKFHLRNVYRKLGVSNRTEAARWAHDHGIQTGAAPTS
jgi:DNA-binding NarL/FixJ family response regulator